MREIQQIENKVDGFLTRIVAYQVSNDGHWDPITFKKDFIDNKKRSKKVFILVDEKRKEIWIWIGGNADVRTRFISSTAAQEIRRLYGQFHVRSVDQGIEPKDFLKCIDIVPLEGVGPSVHKKRSSSVKASESIEIYPPEPSEREMLKTQKLKKTRLPIQKKTDKRSVKPKNEPTNVSTDYYETKLSLVTTPPCPRCETGHLLPYSCIVKVTSRKKEVIPFAKWTCSTCGFSPKGIDF
ncbi:MAG: hypothetical protein ACXADY_16155 [Candidatus Hodarchaeales archaeon]